MFFPTVHEQSLWLSYLLVTVFFIFIFIFRDTISEWKEISKAKCRKWLYVKMLEVSVVGDTAKTSTGFYTVLFNFLDEHFLKPSDDYLYDYLLYGESDYDSDNKDNKNELTNEDGEEDENGEEEENEEEEEDDEEEEEEVYDQEDVNEGIISRGI